ncbi:MAG: hypothetical protein RLZZ282_1056, partial [Verrucomicrobiota bacterium]
EAGRAWVDSAALTQNQKTAMGTGIGSHIREGEHSAWLTWFIQEIKSDLYQVPVENIMIAWSESDYQAAGKWFHSQPAGPAKDFAVSVYADSISEFEPEAAVQWASTLPEGDLREKTLHRISHNWPRKSPEQKAAAEAFEKQLGIKHDK